MNDIVLEVGVKAFIKNGDKFLFLQRAEPYPNDTICKWDIPGGRIHPGEEVLKALKREIKEETGMIINGVEQILTVQDIIRVEGKHTVRITFLVTTNKTRVKLDPKEHQTFQWLTMEEFKKAKLISDIYLKPVIKKHFR